MVKLRVRPAVYLPLHGQYRFPIFIGIADTFICHHRYFSAEKFRDPASHRRTPARTS
jgi:hypothetical protein